MSTRSLRLAAGYLIFLRHFVAPNSQVFSSMAENVMVTATVTVENTGVAGKQLLLQRLPPLKLLPLR